jgi:tetratricopeptide (TPR) repeat protein
VTSFHLGNLYLLTGRPTEAVPHLRLAAAAREQAWVVTNYVNALAQSGDLAEARRVAEQALASSPNHAAELHATLAAVLFRQGDRAAAAQHYRAALRVKPDFALAAQELAALEQRPATTTAPSTAQ